MSLAGAPTPGVAGATPPVARPVDASAPASEEILVTGERPGPGLWRVSSGEHALWILATLEPLPRNMVWRSQDVDSKIAASQAVLSPPRVDTDLGFFRGLALLPSLYAARKNPEGATLERALPHDLYMRWLALRVKYLGAFADDEKLRPLVAAFDLYTKALSRSGLTDDDAVWKDVEEMARRHHVAVAPVTVMLKIADPRGAVRELAQVSKSGEIECLDTTMHSLEHDLPHMRERATLWSFGDVTALRALIDPDEGVACLNALFSVPDLRNEFSNVASRLDLAWLEAADAALSANSSTVAVLPITELLKPGGLLDRLRARGYVIQEPH